MSYLDIQLTAYTTTVSSFVQPAVASPVDVTVANTGWMPLGVMLFVSGAGYYTIERILDATRVRVINVGGTGCVSAGTVVSANARVIAVGQSGGSSGSSGYPIVPSAYVIGSVTAGKVTTMTSNDESFGYIEGGHYTYAGRANEFEPSVIPGPEWAQVRFVGDPGDWYVLITANLTVKSSVSGFTTLDATLAFSTEEGDLTDWSQGAYGEGGYNIHVSTQGMFQMNTTSRSSVSLLAKSTSYDGTLDVLRVQMSAVLLGAVNP